VIGHPFNPPYLVPLVEVVGGRRTAEEAVERAMRIYARFGKHPIRLRREIAGHVANRLQAALWRETLHLVAEGVVSVADVDAAVCEGPGLRWSVMGPNQIFHLGGGQGGMKHFLDHLAVPFSRMWADLGRPEFTPELCSKLIAGVAEEVGSRSIDELECERDQLLAGVLAARVAAARASAQGSGLSGER
jgi:carnitine 3-dehydrogenase